MSKLAEKLSRLLALATLREGEADDEARQNEARNAASLLLQTCQREGVRIKFVLPKQQAAAPTDFVAAAGTDGAGGMSDQEWDNFSDFVRNIHRSAQYQKATKAKRAAWQTQCGTDGTRPDWPPPPPPMTEDPEEFFQRGSVVRVVNQTPRACRACVKPIRTGEWMWTLLKKDGTYSPRFAHEACGHRAVAD